ncbi:MAG: fibronectin/fibrinogen-binding protein, partial [Bacilli bacterium]|nr:fibronectin/fibrinogen-binding protein [Bacilli bacterium]
SEATIRSAANLAAYYSKARFSSTVPVNYTQVKNIKKPKGYKFGQVILKSYKTIYIDPINADKH